VQRKLRCHLKDKSLAKKEIDQDRQAQEKDKCQDLDIRMRIIIKKKRLVKTCRSMWKMVLLLGDKMLIRCISSSRNKGEMMKEKKKKKKGKKRKIRRQPTRRLLIRVKLPNFKNLL
jgi:hypothetical protein